MPADRNAGLALDSEPLIDGQRNVRRLRCSISSCGKPGFARSRHYLVPLALGTAALLPAIYTLHWVPHSWSWLNRQKLGAPGRQGSLFATATHTGARVPGGCLDDQSVNDFSSAMAMSKAGWSLNWTEPSAFKPAKMLYGVGVSNRSYWGYRSLGAGAMTLELRGRGNLTLDFGNAWVVFGSFVIAYLDGQEIARADARNLSVVVTVPFHNRSMFQIVQQMNSVIVLNYMKSRCQHKEAPATSTSLVHAETDAASDPPVSTSTARSAGGRLADGTTTSETGAWTTTSQRIGQPTHTLPRLNAAAGATKQRTAELPATLLNPAMPDDDCGDPCRPSGITAAAASFEDAESTSQTSKQSQTLPVSREVPNANASESSQTLRAFGETESTTQTPPAFGETESTTETDELSSQTQPVLSHHLNETVTAEPNSTSLLTDDEPHSGTVEVVTVETRNGQSSYPVPGIPGAYFRNLGAGRSWHGFITKVQLYHAFVKLQAAASPSKLIILADGGDLAFGGCSSKELLMRYQQTVAASGGAEVICGADSAIWPKHTKWHPEGPEVNDTWRYNRFEARMADMLAVAGLGGQPNPYEAFMWRGPPQYVNSGFIMGPAAALLKILDCMLKYGGEGRDFDDQLALTECMFHRPESLAIDYGGSLVLTLQGFNKNIAKGHGGIVLNRVLAKSQCFLHFNAFENKKLQEWVQTWTAEAAVTAANTTGDRYRYDDNVGHWGGTCTCPGSGRRYEVGDNNNKCQSLACDGGHASPCEARPGDWTGTGMHVTCG